MKIFYQLNIFTKYFIVKPLQAQQKWGIQKYTMLQIETDETKCKYGQPGYSQKNMFIWRNQI